MTLDIISKVLCKIIQVSFAVLMLLIAVATIFLDKNLNNAFPNTVTYANGGYYLVAFIILVVMFFLLRCILGRSDIGEKSYMVLMWILPLAIFLGWQLPVGKWIYWFTDNGDFGSIMYAAIGFDNGQTFADWPYFFRSPNNANLAIVLSWIYKVLPNWRYILLLGAILTNISAVLVALTVENVTKNRTASLCALVLAELLMAMTWRAFLVYTDNYGMIFVALIVWVYSLELTERCKMPIIVVLAAVGTFIKITVAICFFAIVIHRFCILLNENGRIGVVFKKVALLGMVSVLVFGLMLFAQRSLRKYYGLDLEGKYTASWQYMFMLGQNSEMYGVYNNSDLQLRNTIVEDAIRGNRSVDYANRQCLVEALRRVKCRGGYS